MPDDAKRVDSRDDLLATISPKLISPGAEPKPRIGIDFELLEKAERNAENTEEDDIMKRLDAPVLVVFELPDGSEGEKTFKLGQTVEVLKAFVEEEFEIDMGVALVFGRRGDARPVLAVGLPGRVAWKSVRRPRRGRGARAGAEEAGSLDCM